ncbi:MAG: proline--tRNA ligase [Deltaproteobacteria bacterium]|nr:proline--tRNA ligase [Deltaproteobacteria bacterium]
MRYSQMLLPTVKETPADAQVVSHRLMMRAGMIRKVAAGIYNYLPLGLRVMRKVERIIREELDRAGAQELLMPAIQPAELWQESGRLNKYGPELLRFKDRKGSEFCVGPTHEEVVTTLIRDEVKSYRQLPLNVYQIQTKFRDEIRPRFGLMRGREFIMKDAYSFDIDDAAANISYDKMFEAYTRIFNRCGLKFRPVQADTGSIGGARSHEFQVLADTGEDAIVYCDEADYAANVELAAIAPAPDTAIPDDAEAFTKVETPGKKSIDAVADFLGKKASDIIKAVIFIVDEKPVMCLCRGDHEVNEIKVKRALNAENIEMMPDGQVAGLVNGAVGYAGPVDFDVCLVIADAGIRGHHGMVCGANEKGVHLVNVAVGRDFKAEFFDLRRAQKGDPCGAGEGIYDEARGIEVGHIFFLGTGYSEALGCKVLNEKGDEVPLVMGCYGIGVGRTAAAAIEQNHDEGGILWPAPIAPFHVSLLRIGKDDDEAEKLADDIYAELQKRGIEVLYDDRDERPGVKFKDHDLIGNPVRVAVGGRGLKEGIVEVKKRSEGKDGVQKVPTADAVDFLESLVRTMLDETLPS